MPKNIKWEWLVLILLLIAGLVIRLHHLDELFTFTYDQGRDLYVLQNITRGDVTLIGPTTGLPGVFLGPFMYYFLLPGFLLGSGSPFVVVKWLLVAVTLTLPLVYFILKPLVGRFLALMGLIMVLFTAGSFEEARQIWNPSLVVPTLLVSTYCLFRSQKDQRWLIPALLMFGLSLQTELAYTVFLAPLFGLWIVFQTDLAHQLLLSFKKHVQLKHTWLKPNPKTAAYSWKMVLIASIAFGATLLPQALFEVRNNFLITQSFIREGADPAKKVPLQQVWDQRPMQMIEELHHSLTGKAPGFELIGLAVIASLIVVLLNRRSSPKAWFIAGWFALPLIGMMFHTGNYGNWFGYYITAHYLPSILLIIVAISHLPNKRIVASLLTLVWLGIFARYFWIATDVPRYEYTARLQMQALRRARELQQTDRAALEVMVPNLLPINYQYLSEWMSNSGQAHAMDFGATDHHEYILLYEPPGVAHEFTFDPWFAGWHKEAECTTPEKFGIMTVERCVRK
jgi:hypothetical protein